MNSKPPRWADRFLSWYCREDVIEEIRWDLYELFDRESTNNLKSARGKFVWNVIRFCRLKNIRKYKSSNNSNSITMIKNYLLVGFRSMLRNRVTSFINIFGLALGVAGTVIIFIVADQFFHTDDFNLKRDRIYQVTNEVKQETKTVNLGSVPFLLAPTMQDDIPAIEKTTRIQVGNCSVRYGEKVFSESLHFVDNTFTDFFSYPLLSGNNNALKSKSNIVLTRKMAEKYFADANPIGQNLSIKSSNGTSFELTVGAVVDQPPNNTLFFNFLVPLEILASLNSAEEPKWNTVVNATFILLKPQHNIGELIVLMNKYRSLQNSSSPEWLVDSFKFYPLQSLSSRSHEIEGGIMGSGNPQGIYAMSVIASLLLLLTCFNYMNISIATVSTRLKEIGIRKVVGGRKREIMNQFITENFLLCSFSVVLGVAVSYFLFLPGLISILNHEIPFAFSSVTTFISFFAILLSFIVIVTGIYPALYVSNFQPVTIFNQKEKFGQRSKLSRVMLTMQFVFSFITMVGSLVFIGNEIYLRNKGWGYRHDQNIFVPVSDQEQFLKLRDFAASNKNISSYAGSANHIGYSNTRSAVDKVGQRFEIVAYQVGFNYLETMNIRFTKGRSFDKNLASDHEESVIVNEYFVKIMGWINPLDQTFEYGSIKRHVIGVVENFHHDYFNLPILPAIFSIAPEKGYRILSMRVEAGQIDLTVNQLKKIWTKIAPDDPYQGILQDDVFFSFQNNSTNNVNLFGFVALMSLLLACLGLFGLVSYNITRRLKEFCIRKIFGADIRQIFYLMSRDYIWILVIAFTFGAPTGYFLMGNLISQIYANHQTLGIFPFIISITLMAVTVSATVGLQMKRILKANPTELLRCE